MQLDGELDVTLSRLDLLHGANSELLAFLQDAERCFQRTVVQVAGLAKLRIVGIAIPVDPAVEQVPERVSQRGAEVVERQLIFPFAVRSLAVDVRKFGVTVNL